MRKVLVAMAVLAGCVKSQAVQCSDGRTCPAGQVCDDVHHGCVDRDQLADCAGMAAGTDCTLAGGMSAGICRDEVCLPAGCGDGFRRGDELCDGEDFGETPALCTDLDYYEPVALECNSACGYDESVCASAGYCGDTIVNGAELCDGSPPPRTCVDLGYGAGFLDCNMCGPGLDECRFFGWRGVYSAPTNFLSTHGLSENDVWVSGAGSTLLHFDGNQWKATDLSSCVNSSTEPIKLSGVFALGANDAIAVGHDPINDRGVAIRVTSTSCTKTILTPSLATDTDYDVWASGPNDIYVVGDGIHHFDGATWTTSNNSAVLRTVWGRAANDIYAGGTGTLLHYNGSTWSPVTPTAGFTEIWAVGGTSSKVYVSLERPGASTPIYEIWSYDGTWTLSRTSAGAAHGFTNHGDLVFVAEYGNVLAYEGSAWLDLQTKVNGAWDLWAMPSGAVVAAAFAFDVAIYEGTVWTRDASPSLQGAKVTAVRDDRAAAVMGTFGSKKVYLWDGTAWTNNTAAGMGDPKDVWMDPTTGTLFAIDVAGSLWRRPLGGPWAGASEVQPFSSQYAGFAGRTTTDLWIFDTNNVRHWDGATLTCATCSVTGNVAAMWGSASNDWYAVGQAGAIHHWNGSAWAPMTSTVTADLTAIWGSGPTDIFAVGNFGTVVHFDGTAWSKLALPIAVPLFAVTGAAPDDVFIGGFSGFMYHYDGAHWSPVKSEQTVPFTDLAIGGAVLFTMNSGVDRPFRLVRTARW